MNPIGAQLLPSQIKSSQKMQPLAQTNGGMLTLLGGGDAVRK
jgi:hypothetical protein